MSMTERANLLASLREAHPHGRPRAEPYSLLVRLDNGECGVLTFTAQDEALSPLVIIFRKMRTDGRLEAPMGLRRDTGWRLLELD